MADTSPSIEVLSLVIGKNFIIFPLPKVIKFFCLLTIISFYLILVLGCAYTFTCSSFTPSPHYLGSFLGFNRFYVMSFVLLTITTGLLYIGLYLEIKNQCNPYEDLAIKIASISTLIFLPLISITNEVNSSHFISFTFTYSALTYLTLGLNLIWLALTWLKLKNKANMKSHFTFCSIWLVGLLTLWVLVVVQRDQNYKTENWFINTTAWSGLEWVFLTGKLVFLGLLSNFTRSFKVLIGHSKQDLDAKDQIELEELGGESK